MPNVNLLQNSPHGNQFAKVAVDHSGIFAASSFNGDNAKGRWLSAIAPFLLGACQKVSAAVQLVAQGFVVEHMSLIKRGSLTPRESSQLTRDALRFGFDKLIFAQRNAAITLAQTIITNQANRVYIASSANLIEGLHEQLREDGLNDVQLLFDPSDEYTPRTLIINGAPLPDLLAFAIQQQFSTQWFATIMAQAFTAAPDLNVLNVTLVKFILLRQNVLEKQMRIIAMGAFNIAIRDAAAQFAALETEVAS